MEVGSLSTNERLVVRLSLLVFDKLLRVILCVYLLHRPYQATRATGELCEPLLVYQTQVTRLVGKKIVDRNDIDGIGTKFVIASNIRR